MNKIYLYNNGQEVYSIEITISFHNDSPEKRHASGRKECGFITKAIRGDLIYHEGGHG